MEEHEIIDNAKGMRYCNKCMYWHSLTISCDCDTSAVQITNKEVNPKSI